MKENKKNRSENAAGSKTKQTWNEKETKTEKIAKENSSEVVNIKWNTKSHYHIFHSIFICILFYHHMHCALFLICN